MALADRTHSRLVGTLKLVLPLAALVLLSLLFLLARTRDPEAALPFARVDVADLLRDPRLTAPTYSGMTREGDEVIFTARTAHPAGSEGSGARAVAPVLRLVGPDGDETRARADEARIDPAAHLLQLDGSVLLETSDGLRLETARLMVHLDRTRVESPGPVLARSPRGDISADRFVLDRSGGNGQEVLVFKGNVKLLYRPQDPSTQP